VIVPERVLVAVFASTVKETVPLPLPVVPESLIQLAAVDAVHMHPAPAMTLNDPDPPAAGSGDGTLVGFS
jgi:hypothetical protein